MPAVKASGEGFYPITSGLAQVEVCVRVVREGY
jgi:hypothetical protein